jgi:carbon-monoxide dehydrogenase iron sulfur subunit
MERSLVVRVERCVGCRACELACAVAHSAAKELQGAVLSGEKLGHRVTVEAFGRKGVPVCCNHCEQAACLIVCPTGAIHREADGGPVLQDDERCIGCHMCVQACPFGVIAMRADGKGVLKCDLCAERLGQGQEPACVSACLTKALSFLSESEANQAKRQKVAAGMAADRDQP